MAIVLQNIFPFCILSQRGNEYSASVKNSWFLTHWFGSNNKLKLAQKVEVVMQYQSTLYQGQVRAIKDESPFFLAVAYQANFLEA